MSYSLYLVSMNMKRSWEKHFKYWTTWFFAPFLPQSLVLLPHKFANTIYKLHDKGQGPIALGHESGSGNVKSWMTLQIQWLDILVWYALNKKTWSSIHNSQIIMQFTEQKQLQNTICDTKTKHGCAYKFLIY